MDEMEKKRLVLVFFTILALCIQLSYSQKLVVNHVSNPEEKYVIDMSSDDGYGLKNMDIIWNISYSANITINRFDLNSQGGDFVIICEYPLPSELVVNGAAAEDVIHLLPIEKSLILFQEIIHKKENAGDSDNDVFTVHIGNPYGGFLYLHSVGNSSLIKSRDHLSITNTMNRTIEDEEDIEYQTQIEQQEESGEDSKNKNAEIDADEPYEFQGFNLIIEYLELNPPTTTTTTTEALPTLEDIYLVKHLRGKNPAKFYECLDTFKANVVNVGNEYCVNQTGIELSREINPSDIRLDEESIFFCEQRLQYYNECVIIKLAIFVPDTNGDYFMNKTSLEEMWTMYSTNLTRNCSLTTYEPEEKDLEPINTWLWLAAVLTVILMFSSILCFTFLGNFFQNRTMDRKETEAGSTMIQNESGHASSIGSSFIDNNPIIGKLIQTIKKGQEDSEHFVMFDRDIAIRGGEALNRKSTTVAHERSDRTNKISNNYQRQELKSNPMSFLNDGFLQDDDEEFPSNRQNHHQHHTFQAQVHSSQNDEDSDEEVEFWTSK